MDRIRESQLAPIITDFLRVGMWPITKPVGTEFIDPETGFLRRIYKYGTDESGGIVEVQGKLTEADRGTFLIIRAMDQANGYEGINGFITDLVKMKGVKNPWDSKHQDAMWNSVDALIHVQIRIKPNRPRTGLSAAFKLVQGWVNSDGEYFLITHDYMKIMESLGLVEHNIVLKDYHSSHSPITRSLKVFLQTQDGLSSHKGYSISLAKLCNYIGYDMSSKPFWQVWQHISDSMNELKQAGFLDNKSARDLKRNRHEGGILTFYRDKKHITKTDENDEAVSPEDFYNEVLQLFPDKFQTDKLFQRQLRRWIHYRQGLKIVNYRATMEEWSKHSIEEVNFQINKAISNNWKSLFFTIKKELKCPHGWRFGVDLDFGKEGCMNQCSIMEKCQAAMNKNKRQKTEL